MKITKGAAIATGMSQILVLILLLLHFVFRKGDLSFFKAKFKFEIFKRISLRGLPEAIAQCSASVTTLWLNKVLIERIGDIGVNAFSIVSYVATFSMGIFFGVSEGLQPLFGYSHGSKNKEDLKFYFISGFFINFFGSSLINILLLFIGNQICRLFGASNELLEYTVQSIPKYSWGFIITGFITVISSYLFSTEKTTSAIILNTTRSFITNTILILLFPILFGNSIIWYTFGISEIMVLCLGIVLLSIDKSKKISPK